MTKEYSTQANKSCPFWDSHANNECTMYQGGVFLPMASHVARYCQSPRYRYCQQYLRGAVGRDIAARREAAPLVDSRRLDERLRRRYALRVYACDVQGNPLSLLSDEAETVDLSAGGLGLSSAVQVVTGQHVAIHFGAGFTVPGLSSNGVVRWCQATGDNGYRAGVAFASDKMGQVVAGLVAQVN
ncbi:MAG: PilZ domain-containing protein [Thermodesulfobacteriota bacterium]